MKIRVLTAMIIMTMVFCITGCGGSNNDEQRDVSSESVTEKKDNEAIEDKTNDASAENESEKEDDKQDSEQDAAKENKPSNEGELGDYYVKIKKATYCKDYDGNKIIVVHYDFTNNNKKANAALFSINVQAYQDGTELENAIVMDRKKYDAGIAQKKIKKGKTIKDCQEAFVLDSKKPVEVEVTELISLDDEKKVTKTFKIK